MAKINRNDLCPCGSGLKYKFCHGDPVKIEYTNHVANEIMNVLIVEEMKRRGLTSYQFKCNSCNIGFDVPDISTVEPAVPICPECGSIKIERVKNESVGN